MHDPKGMRRVPGYHIQLQARQLDCGTGYMLWFSYLVGGAAVRIADAKCMLLLSITGAGVAAADPGTAMLMPWRSSCVSLTSCLAAVLGVWRGCINLDATCTVPTRGHSVTKGQPSKRACSHGVAISIIPVDFHSFAQLQFLYWSPHCCLQMAKSEFQGIAPAERRGLTIANSKFGLQIKYAPVTENS